MRCVASISPILTVSKGVSVTYISTNLILFPSTVAFWKPPSYNSPYQNWKRGMYAMTGGIFLVEPIRHFASNVSVMN